MARQRNRDWTLYPLCDECYNPEGVEFKILGPLEVVERGKIVPLGSRKARSLLALLLLRANEVVSTDRLVDDLWGEQPPPTAIASLHNFVARLRKTLGPDVIVSRPHGYMLQLAPEQLDLSRFERLVADARDAEPAARAEKLREALALWRGPALDDLAFEPFVEIDIARLGELRLTTLEDRIEADLALGRHAELVPELETLVAEHPLRERPRGQLMLALYRSGRQAEALEAYADGRRALVDELGIEPSPALRQLEQAILRQDEALEPAAAPGLRRRRGRAPTEWRRKTVTVLFAELVASSASGASADPEAVHELIAGFFGELREAVESHGGTPVELPGDAAMAVFGAPVLHEDDALRAVRAAEDLRAALGALGETVSERGLRLELRAGVNTGEVLAGANAEEDTEVSGDPVVVARRLQERAEPGEILLGPATLTLVRDAADVESAGQFEIAGRPEPMPAFRLRGVRAGVAGVVRRFDVPLVGREAELAQLRDAFAEANAERRCRWIALVGDPGIGKTRLAAEVAARLADKATVLSARCPSYGTGATWLPLAEIVGQATGERSEAAIATALGDADGSDQVARRIAELIGLAEGSGSSGEAFWAVRRFLETLARERPLVLVLEDLHWAEPTFLDLVAYLDDSITDSAMLLLATARPELLETRPDFAATALTLEPLSELESHVLVGNLAEGEPEPDVRARIVETAEGNPLFVEQLLAYRREAGEAATLPPSLEALLESRLDLLEASERVVLERAAVVGREFWRGAVIELSAPAEAAAAARHLMTLARRGLVHADRAGFAREDAFRFHHALVRDVAYAGIAKATRAELHERLADWLDRQETGQDELSGTHLEQASRYQAELGAADRAVRRLAEDAGVRLGRAGIRAFKRGDIPATVNLLTRATDLLPRSDSFARELACELGLALRTAGELERAETVLSAAADASAEARDRRVELRARLELANVQLLSDPQGAPEFLDLADSVTPAFEAFGDDRALGRAWLLVGAARGGFYCQNAAWEHAAGKAFTHYERAGWPAAYAVTDLAAALFYGPRHVEEAVVRCEELLRDSRNRSSEASVLVWMGGLSAMRGDFELGRELIERSRTILNELGQAVAAANNCAIAGSTVELLAGDVPAAERILRASCDFCAGRHEWALLSTRAAELADVLYAQGRFDEADEYTNLAARHAATADVSAQFWWRSVRAKLLARSDRAEEGERRAREAVDVVAATDALNDHARVLLALAEVLRLGGRFDEAARVVEEAITLYKRKGNAVAAERERELLPAMDHA